jgi:hypothetical protein
MLSALSAIADIERAFLNVRVVPRADITASPKLASREGVKPLAFGETHG